MGVAPHNFPLFASLVLAVAAYAGDSRGVFGTVRDARGRALTDADIQVQSESTGARWKTSADDTGRCEFAIYRRSSLEASLNIFNLPNHPAFADPVPYLSSP